MQALHDVVQAGMVRYIGMSSCHAYQFHQMQSESVRAASTASGARRSESQCAIRLEYEGACSGG